GQVTRGYVGSVGWLLRGSLLVIAAYGGLLYLTYHTFRETPTGFIPSQDKGYLLVNILLPDSASLERTNRVMEQIEKLAGKTAGVKHTVAIAGQSILLGGRGPPGGFKIVIEDRGNNGLAALQRTSQQIVDEGKKTPGLDKLFTSFRADTTWLFLDIDRDAADSM